MGVIVDICAINKTIQQLCVDVSANSSDGKDWRSLSEVEVFQEIAICIIGSQMVFEQSIVIAENLKKSGLLMKAQNCSFDEFSCLIEDLLSKPMFVKINRGKSEFKPRFKNRIAKLISKTAEAVYGEHNTFKDLLSSSGTPVEARKLLVGYVSGFGPKQASLFLRRIGYCDELAVLDTHVLDYLSLACDLKVKPSALSSLNKYESIESKFTALAKSFGYGVGCVDLAMWVTMRVAKREYAI